MTTLDWFMTGRNNAFDWLMYAPPRGVSHIDGAVYRVGWFVGMWGYPFSRRRSWRK
jgi:hypothetical protein